MGGTGMWTATKIIKGTSPYSANHLSFLGLIACNKEILDLQASRICRCPGGKIGLFETCLRKKP